MAVGELGWAVTGVVEELPAVTSGCCSKWCLATRNQDGPARQWWVGGHEEGLPRGGEEVG